MLPAVSHQAFMLASANVCHHPDMDFINVRLRPPDCSLLLIPLARLARVAGLLGCLLFVPATYGVEAAQEAGTDTAGDQEAVAGQTAAEAPEAAPESEAARESEAAPEAKAASETEAASEAKEEQKPELPAEQTGKASAGQESAPDEPASAGPPAPAPAAPPSPERVEDLAAYLASVRTHVENDPALASAYLVFWSELTSASPTPGILAAPAATNVDANRDSTTEPAGKRYAAIADVAGRVSGEIARQYGKGDVKFLVADVMQRTMRVLSDSSSSKGGKVAAEGQSAADRLLAKVDSHARPEVTADGRYRFGSALRTLASIGSSAEVWNLCRAVRECVSAHDRLFAPAMAGVSLVADAKRRMSSDAKAAQTPLWQHMQPIAAGVDADLAKLPDLAARNAALNRAAQTQWKTALDELPTTGDPKASSSTLIPDGRIDALFTLGQAGAELAGAGSLAKAFSLTRKPALDLVSLAGQGAAAQSMLTGMAGVALLVAGVQAISLLDGGGADARAAAAEMRELVVALDARTLGVIRDASAAQLLAIDAVDAKVASLGLAVDVVKTDVARLERATRKRIAADWQTETARRWSDFDAANDRCFSLRRRDPETRRLSAADFRWCEERFLQGAVLKSRYSNRSSEYALDPRFAEATDLEFPFHSHYPLLLVAGGMEERQALALPDPVEWQQHASALLRLYLDHPAAAADFERRSETLANLSAAGERLRTALSGLVVGAGKDGRPGFRTALHAQTLDAYISVLERLAQRVTKLDDPSAHPFGKRMTAGLDQPMPEGSRRSAIDNRLRRDLLGEKGLQTCPGADPVAFLPVPERLLVDSRRFFGSPITGEEVSLTWNREMVNRLGLETDSMTSVIPEPFIWAGVEGLGRLSACIARLRPESLEFTREDGPARDTLKGSALIGADIEVYFEPGGDAARALEVAKGTRILLARQTAGRACTFGYRNDDEGCSRARCLADIAPTLWGTDKRSSARHVSCSETPLRKQIASVQPQQIESLELMADRLAKAYWPQQAERLSRIEADALRSDEFVDASGLWLKYYAMAGTTLGPWPQPADLLSDLFSDQSRFAPREVVRTMLQEHAGADAIVAALRKQLTDVNRIVDAQGDALLVDQSWTRLPHLAALSDMQDRIRLLQSRYEHSSAGR